MNARLPPDISESIKPVMQKFMIQQLTRGAQAVSLTILDYIHDFDNAQEKSIDEYQKLVSKIKKFCEVATNTNINEDGQVVQKQKDATE